MKPEPSVIYIGDDVTWNVVLSDYEAPDWVLHYSLFNKDANHQFDCTADGVEHKAAPDTSTWSAGRFDFVAYVAKGAEQHTVATGVFTVKPDPTAATNYDGRSHAQRMLESIEAIIEGRYTTQDMDLVKGQFGERAVERDPQLLQQWRDKYKAEVADEQAAAALADGAKKSNNIKMRFTNPS